MSVFLESTWRLSPPVSPTWFLDRRMEPGGRPQSQQVGFHWYDFRTSIHAGFIASQGWEVPIPPLMLAILHSTLDLCLSTLTHLPRTGISLMPETATPIHRLLPWVKMQRYPFGLPSQVLACMAPLWDELPEIHSWTRYLVSSTCWSSRFVCVCLSRTWAQDGSDVHGKQVF